MSCSGEKKDSRKAKKKLTVTKGSFQFSFLYSSEENNVLRQHLGCLVLQLSENKWNGL